MRNIKIIRDQFKGSSFRGFFYLLGNALFFNKSIIIYGKNISNTEIEDFGSYPGIKMEKGTLLELEKAKKIIVPLPWEFQCHEYDGVLDFFVAKNSEGIQHISWIYFHIHRNRLLSLAKNEAEIKYCLTIPAFRGCGIYHRVIHSIINYLRIKDIRRVFMCVLKENKPSIRGIEKAGFKKVGEIRLRKIMGIQISSRFDTSRMK